MATIVACGQYEFAWQLVEHCGMLFAVSFTDNIGAWSPQAKSWSAELYQMGWTIQNGACRKIDFPAAEQMPTSDAELNHEHD